MTDRERDEHRTPEDSGDAAKKERRRKLLERLNSYGQGANESERRGERKSEREREVERQKALETGRRGLGGAGGFIGGGGGGAG
ncbi:MAG: hypothetical protein ACR2GU_02970 [Rubrobacteraceae bacterium]